jgi:hypothetical protein
VKRLEVARWTFGIAAVLILSFSGGLLFAGDHAVGREDYEKLAEEEFANADGTRKIVAGVLETVSKEAAAPDASNLLKAEVADAKNRFGKADELLHKCKKRMAEKKYDKDLVMNPNQAWKWFIKAGSAAVRASMMP